MNLKLELSTFLCAFLLLFYPSNSCLSSTEIKVLATIAPLYSLVASITDQIVPTELLMDGSQSPHHYSLKSSDLRKLKDASVIFAIDPNLEAFATKFEQTTFLSSGITMLTKRNKNTKQSDPHIWLSISNAKKMIYSIKTQLINIDPINHIRYQHNYEITLKKLEDLLHYYSEKFSIIPKHGYIVFHDAYQYFEKEFNLSPAMVKKHSDLSMKDLMNINRDKQKGCIIEEDIPIGSMGYKLAKVVKLDPLGKHLAISKDSYFTIMHNIARGFIECMESNYE